LGYGSAFAGTENPISEGGIWRGGFTTGLKWANVQKTPGLAFGRQQIDVSGGFRDATAILTTPFSANQRATGTIVNLRSAISANTNRGYECSLSMDQGGGGYAIIVVWHGDLGDFDYIGGSPFSGSQYNVVTGDTITADAIGNVISLYKNGVLIGSATDSEWSDGTPGMGFNLEAAGAGHNAEYGFSQWAAHNL
jgi:hypothetical protein